MTIRTGNVERQTRETRISVALTLDGKGECRIRTGFGFADHMLELMVRWAGFDLELSYSVGTKTLTPSASCTMAG